MIASFALYLTLIVLIVAKPQQYSDNSSNSNECKKIQYYIDQRISACCKIPKIVTEDLDDTVQNCFELNFQNHSPNKHSKRISRSIKSQLIQNANCIDECIFNRTGLLTTEGKLNPEEISNWLTGHSENQATWREVAEKNIENCIHSANSHAGTSACKSGSSQFLDCMNREYFLNCPNDDWVSSENCNDLKGYIESCPEAVISSRNEYLKYLEN